MAEYFDLLSPTGEPLGITKERNAVHRDCFNDESGTKSLFPASWIWPAPAMWTPARTT